MFFLPFMIFPTFCVYAISISNIFIQICYPKGDGWWGGGGSSVKWEWFLQMVDREL